jgi:subtilisin family serine protease
MAKPSRTQQIERILDENNARRVSVIFQAVPQRLSDAAAEAARRLTETRSLTRARDLLPEARSPHRRKAEKGRAAEREQRIAEVRAVGVKALQPLQESSVMAVSRLARQGAARSVPQVFELAGAAAVDVDRDDLLALEATLPPQVSVHPNRRITLPPRMQSREVPAQVERRTSHAWGLDKTGALACWGAFGARGKGVQVAVLDTGVNAQHPDLAARVKKFAEIGGNGKIARQGVREARDEGGHGTHVCGTIAGGRASGRWIGMAPEVDLLACKVLGRTGGYDSQIIAGIEWAITNGADIINMSLGGVSWDPDVLDTYSGAILAAHNAGALVVAAIGNEGQQTSGSPGNDVFALAVGATDIMDGVAAFSGGRTQVIQKSSYVDAAALPFVYSKPDLCAPGVDVYSAVGKSSWGYESGTSMACPHVAGAAALLLSRIDGAPESDLRLITGRERVETLQALLLGAVHELGENGQDHRFGWGRLNVLNAFGVGVERGLLSRA